MAYKKLIKVSEYCQLLDKSKYPATLTRKGITWTNNGDGTITANGTLTINAYSSFDIASNIQIVKGHKYALLGGQGDNNIIGNLILRNINQSDYDGKWWYVSTRTNWIGVAPASFPAKSWMDFGNAIGYVADNLVFKPQLFDLTEMYGAGNEPTTVEQFRADFPDELYDYSPYCWLTSYKRVFTTGGGDYLTSYQRNLTCKTKNLWTCNKTSNFYTYDKSSQVFTIFGTGLASCYTLPTPIKAGETFTISVYCLSGEIPSGSTVTIGGYHFGEQNSWQTEVTIISAGNVGGKVYYNTVTTTDTLTDFLIFVYNIGPTNLKVRIQFERGSTATDYVPYGHL